MVLSAAGSASVQILRTPAGIDDEVAAGLPTPGLTAAAAISAVGLSAGDTVLVGGAAGGVGVLTVQLARLAGARVIGTASTGTFAFLRQLGAEPVAYGTGLVESVRAQVPDGLSAAIDLNGTETAEAALALGVDPNRISTIAAGPNPPGGVWATGGFQATPADLEAVAAAVLAGSVVVPIAARLPWRRSGRQSDFRPEATSTARSSSRCDLDDLQRGQRHCRSFEVYGSPNSAVLLLIAGLQRRPAGSGSSVRSTAADLGWVSTGFRISEAEPRRSRGAPVDQAGIASGALTIETVA